MRALEDDVDIERAITVLVDSFEESGENPKPVVLHSVRVGMDLYNRGYHKRIVIAGLLHDLLEDTGVRKAELRSEFGDDVAEIVAATSFDAEIEEYTDRYQETLTSCFEMGREPVVVKAADILDNCEYYHVAESEELRTNLVEKMEFFIENSEPYVGDEQLHQELETELATVKERIEGVDG